MLNSIAHFLCALFSRGRMLSLALLAGSALLLNGSAFAFELDGPKWLGAKAVYYVDMAGMSATEISWNSAVIQSLDEWTEKTLFDFSLVEENFDPCLNNNISSIDFSSDYCGTSFGSNVLAITVRRFENQILGPPSIRESDIVVKEDIDPDEDDDWNIFDGDIVQFGITGLDFKRTVLHELGHVIGLSHENQAEAIMAPSIGDIFELQQDDIDGVEALYTGLSNCEINALQFGQTSDVLNDNDCTVSEMTVGGSDDSFLDLYRFDLTESTDVQFDASSSELDAVLILATTELEYLQVDTKNLDSCDSTLSRSLDAGSYFLIVNTFTQPTKEDCGVEGSYSLFSQFTSAAKPDLGTSISLSGTATQAQFAAGISADNGASFGNVFSSTDSLDITATISVDSAHEGLAGFLVVAALIEDQILMLNIQGEFFDVTANPIPPLRFTSKLLQANEPITIATDMVPADLGFTELEADIVVGYGLDSNPNEIFFHQVPLNLTIRPDA